MMRSAIVLALVVASVSTAQAGQRKVLVLPLDGSAPAATRQKLSASLQRMARILDGEVQPGNATLRDTATAIACDPNAIECVESVRTMLGVDELVYGTADARGDQIVVVARRYEQGKQPRELTFAIASSDPPSKIEPQLLPLLGTDALPASPEAPLQPTPPAGDRSPNRERNIWISVTAGGGVLCALGLALWAGKRSLQDDIDDHPTTTPADFERLEALEDKASSRAWAGNFFVGAGLAIVAYGGYRLYKSSKQAVMLTPTPVDGGATVTLTWRGASW